MPKKTPLLSRYRDLPPPAPHKLLCNFYAHLGLYLESESTLNIPPDSSFHFTLPSSHDFIPESRLPSLTKNIENIKNKKAIWTNPEAATKQILKVDRQADSFYNLGAPMPMPQSLPAGIRTSRAVVRGAWWSERETRLKFPIISLQLDSRAERPGEHHETKFASGVETTGE